MKRAEDSRVDERTPEDRALAALAAAGVDPAELSGRSRRYLANRLRRVIEALPAGDGPNRATVRDLRALCDALERGPEP